MIDTIFDDDYTGPRFKYGGNYRPLGVYGNQPNDFIIGSVREDDRFPFGIIEYPFELSIAQITSFELTPVE